MSDSLTTPTIDSHQHFWDRSDKRFDHAWQQTPGMESICRNFLPSDLEPLLEANAIDFSVCVQTQHNLAENLWALQLADDHPFIAGVVGWVDLIGDDCESQVLEFKAHAKFVGARHVVQDEPDSDFIVCDDASRGLALLEKHQVPFDLLFYPQHLKHAATVGRSFPDLKLVLDHMSKPNIKTGEFDDWKREIADAAGCKNMFCKISGMITEADWMNWKLDDFRPYVDHVLNCFGVERLMFGSDWPVSCLAGSYSQVLAVAQGCLNELSADEQAWVFGRTAKEFYNLDV